MSKENTFSDLERFYAIMELTDQTKPVRRTPLERELDAIGELVRVLKPFNTAKRVRIIGGAKLLLEQAPTKDQQSEELPLTA